MIVAANILSPRIRTGITSRVKASLAGDFACPKAYPAYVLIPRSQRYWFFMKLQ